MPKWDIISAYTGFTNQEIDDLSRIYDVALAAEKGNVVINCYGGNIFGRLRDKPELVEFIAILKRRFPDGFSSINWDMVEKAIGTKRC